MFENPICGHIGVSFLALWSFGSLLIVPIKYTAYF